MQTVLSQLNSVPGVAGSLVCDLDGRLVARVFPPIFDASALEDAVRALAEGAVGLDISSETAELLDFRFKEGRLLVKPFGGSMLVVFCTKAINVQFLVLSVAAAVAKLERLRQSSPGVPTAAPGAPAASVPVEASPGADPKQKKRIAAPSKGLDELRRRLAEAAGGPRADGTPIPPPDTKASTAAPAGGEARAKQDESQTTGAPGMRWWEGMS